MTAKQGEVTFESGLDKASSEKARLELNERCPADRDSAVLTLRQWLNDQDWIRSPTDYGFLLRYLRCRKFSQLEAREKLRKYWQSRSSRPEWFQDIDPCSPTLQALLRMGILQSPLQRDKKGRRMVCVRLGCHNQKLVLDAGMDNYYKAMVLFYDWLALDEHVQVDGLTILFDFTGFTFQTYTALFKAEHLIYFFTYLQNGFPARIKTVIIYNQPAFFDVIYAIVSPILTKKISSRIRLIGRSLTGVYEETGYECLLEDYLPDDYTGETAGNAAQLVEQMISAMTTEPTKGYLCSISGSCYGVDKKKASAEMTKSASFRKLCLD